MTVPTYQYRTVVTIEPTVEPVTLAEAKTHLRVDGNAEDDLITGLIVSAREWAEGVTRRAFINRTVRLSMDEFPEFIRLPFGKTQSVTSITYSDEDEVTQTLSALAYTVDTDSEPARIVTATDYDWPSIASVPNAAKVLYVAGYGAAATAVPSPVKDAIKLYVLHLYERDAATESVVTAAENLLNKYRILEFF